jgi:hypothetical protein
VASTAAEETGSSGIDGGGVDWRSRERGGGDLESFGMENETTRGRLLFIGSKISAVVN